MKSPVTILLALGVIGVIASPVSKQTITSDNKNPQPSENIESQTEHDESTLNNGIEQKKQQTIEPTVSNDRKCDDKVDIIIEETVTSAVDGTSNMVDDIPIEDDLIINDDVPSPIDNTQIPIDEPPSLIDAIQLPQLQNDVFGDDFLGSDVSIKDGPVNAIQDEIMQTAAGFVPTPLVFRRKQKPRRRFANRRHFRPNPFRRKFNLFYPYYGFYHPSSLRFY